jgi:hypothetical protein
MNNGKFDDGECKIKKNSEDEAEYQDYLCDENTADFPEVCSSD